MTILSSPRRDVTRGAATVVLVAASALVLGCRKPSEATDTHASASAASSSTPLADDPSAKAALMKRLGDIQPGEEREMGDGTFMKVHRLQATAPIVGGWQRAESTEGGFSVEIPLPFNDFRIRSEATDKVEIRSHTVGAKTAGLLSWSATCMVRRDGKSDVDPKVDKPSDDVEAVGTPVRAYQRTIALPDRRCFLIVEAQGTDPLPPEKDRARFFQSWKKTGAPKW